MNSNSNTANNGRPASGGSLKAVAERIGRPYQHLYRWSKMPWFPRNGTDAQIQAAIAANVRPRVKRGGRGDKAAGAAPIGADSLERER